MLGSDSLYLLTLLASALWFLSGFNFFSFQSETSAKLLVPMSSPSTSPVYRTMVAALPFLGGLNGSLALLCLLLLGVAYRDELDLFDATGERLVILSVISSAHFSQFICNVPILLDGERQWPVLSGQMKFIFFIDLAQAVLAAVAAAAQPNR